MKLAAEIPAATSGVFGKAVNTGVFTNVPDVASNSTDTLY